MKAYSSFASFATSTHNATASRALKYDYKSLVCCIDLNLALAFCVLLIIANYVNNIFVRSAYLVEIALGLCWIFVLNYCNAI